MKMLHIIITVSVTSFLLAMGSNAQRGDGKDPLQSLAFLQGTWNAKTNANGSAGAMATGAYTFMLDLKGHALQRTSSVDKCSGPNPFDCQHHDQLTIYTDSTGILRALYIDSEGHVIDYRIETPDPATAIFVSQGAPAAPHFKLTYHLDGNLMRGKFEGAAPGSTDFHSYLEWSGTKQ